MSPYFDFRYLNHGLQLLKLSLDDSKCIIPWLSSPFFLHSYSCPHPCCFMEIVKFELDQTLSIERILIVWEGKEDSVTEIATCHSIFSLPFKMNRICLSHLVNHLVSQN